MEGKAEDAQHWSQENSYLVRQEGRTSLIISVVERVGALAELLAFFSSRNISLSHIESRPSKQRKGNYDFFVDVQGLEVDPHALVEELKKVCVFVHLLGTSSDSDTIPYFPRNIRDLDRFAHQTLEYGSDLSSDHPGFNDATYRHRRLAITQVARDYKHGQAIPRIEYTEQEIGTWATVYKELTALYKTHACKEHNMVLPLLEQFCGYGPHAIPQLEDISSYLKSCSGFRLRPVAGLLSSRDFLNGLAFRVFHSTQYIRHHSKPLYTPEPDVCHELLGHVPLFADPAFAEFSQEIGLLSLGVSDDDIKKLATCYWFTIEFGLCREGSGVKAYGAGLLSSYGELQYCLTDKPERRTFDPVKTCLSTYPITEYQPLYYVADSFESAKNKLREFGKSLSRPFSVSYNPYTESVEVLNESGNVTRLAKQLRSDFNILVDAMERLNTK